MVLSRARARGAPDPGPAPGGAALARAATPAVSVIVPAHDAAGRLPQLLQALEGQSLPPDDYEVIIVDDGSRDGTAEVATATRLVRVIRLPRRGGSYAARNVALPGARAEVLAFTDTDCVPARDWLEAGLTELESSGADLLAGHIHVPLGVRPTVPALLGVAKHHLDQEHHVEHQRYGATANLFVRRDVFRRVGPFNGNLLSGADGEFGRRATAAGAKLRYSGSVVVTHGPRSRHAELFKKQLRIGFGAAQYRHHAPESGAEIPRIWARPGAYVPRLTVSGLDVLQRRGYRPTRAQRLAMPVVQYLCYQLPIALGNLAGAAHLQWRRLAARRRQQ